MTQVVGGGIHGSMQRRITDRELSKMLGEDSDNFNREVNIIIGEEDEEVFQP
jgi:hypothetical protein